MAKNNNHKKLFRMDEFGRRFYCQHARLNLIRTEKKQAKKKARQERKRLPSKQKYNIEVYMEKKLDWDTCKAADVEAAGLSDNIFINPVRREGFVYEMAELIYHDIHVAERDVKGFENATDPDHVQKIINDLAHEIFLTFFDVEDEEFMNFEEDDEAFEGKYEE